MSRSKIDGADKLTPLERFEDDSYGARCKLKFAMSVFREFAAGNVNHPEFSADELNGLTLLMDGAIEELDGLLRGPEGLEGKEAPA